MATDNKTRAMAGCVGTLVGLFIVLPLYAAVLIGLMLASNAPTWVWTCFWVFMGLNTLIRIGESIAVGLAAAAD
jgi:hypothetical protein